MLRPDRVGEFNMVAAFDRRVSDSAVADEVAARILAADPQAKAVRLPVIGGALEEGAALLFAESVAVGRQRRHYARVAVQAANIGKVARARGRADKAKGAQFGFNRDSRFSTSEPFNNNERLL